MEKKIYYGVYYELLDIQRKWKKEQHYKVKPADVKHGQDDMLTYATNEMTPCYDCLPVYRIRSIRRRSRLVAAPPDVLSEIVAALEYILAVASIRARAAPPTHNHVHVISLTLKPGAR